MSGRMRAAADRATEEAGVRFSRALIELKQAAGGATLTEKDQANAAAYACLNRRERRRLRRAK